MMLRSFRLRLAVLSAMVSGLVLMVFGGVSWVILSRQKLEILDAELQHYGYRVASRVGPSVEGSRTEANMLEVFGVQKAEFRFFSLLRERDGELLHQTEHWPRGLDVGGFPGSDRALDPQPVVPESERHRGRGRDPLPRPRIPRVILEPRYRTVVHEGRRYRVGTFGNSEVRVILGADLDQYDSDVRELRKALLIALPGALILIALGAAFLSKRALRPVRIMSERMEQLSSEGLDQRLEGGRTDIEFRRIIDAYNSMSERLERSFHQATRFSGDVSHELKTPLAVMQAILERALAGSEDESDEQSVYSDLLDEVRHQRSIVDSLLLLARADSGELRLSRERVDLSVLLESVKEDAEILAEGKGIMVEGEIEPGLMVSADPVLLQQALHNLVANAVKYNFDGGRLGCSLDRNEEWAEVKISNTGAAIPRAEWERIFERFCRAHEGGPQEGAGLGLSLTREIIVAHGGEVWVMESGPDGLTTFCAKLELE